MLCPSHRSCVSKRHKFQHRQFQWELNDLFTGVLLTTVGSGERKDLLTGKAGGWRPPRTTPEGVSAGPEMRAGYKTSVRPRAAPLSEGGHKPDGKIPLPHAFLERNPQVWGLNHSMSQFPFL